MPIPGVYSDGKRTVRLEEVYQNKCYITIEGRLVLMGLDAFVNRYTMLYR